MPASSDRAAPGLRWHRFSWLLLALQTACSGLSPLKAMEATADGITFEYSSERADDAARQASLYCANLGRTARRRDVTREADAATRAVFDCR